MNDDLELVRQYALDQSEQAFETLVSRYIGLVYSAALRQVRDPGLAQEITQSVFVILARKAGSIRSGTILPGWLYRTTRYVAAAALKMQQRRERRELEVQMQAALPETDPAWEQLAPALDEAMAQLRDKDRDAILLRFFHNKSLREVGAAFGMNEYAAQKRVSRALEKLRKFFAKRGVASTTSAIGSAISANSIHAAPVGLVKIISVAALTQGAAASASTLTLAKGALKLMAWTKAKTAMVAGVVILLAAGTVTIPIYVHHAKRHPFNPDDFWATNYPKPDFNAGKHGDDLSNWTFPASPIQLCSISGLLNQCMNLTGWQYLIDKNVAAGNIQFGNAKPLNGEEWVAAFENALQSNKPQWYDPKTKKFRVENLVLIRYPDQKIVLVLPPEKAAQYQNLPAETTEAMAKKFEPAASETSDISPETAFLQESTNRLNLAKQWGLCCRIFAQEHNSLLPDNMAQLRDYTHGPRDTNWEMVSSGSLDSIRNPGATILLREKESRQGPDGAFVKAYTFVDGRARLETSPDGNFATLEQQRGFLVYRAGN
ncbi:MAG TPA: sigma-70 family RNA polymerase sigma factor [Pseudomonadales bacterium]|nr:sigma-70 family RNA polymerase sigma factor [Pseudomonadales bacterium]